MYKKNTKFFIHTEFWYLNMPVGNAGTNQGQYIFGCFEHYINKAEDWRYVVVCGCVNSSR